MTEAKDYLDFLEQHRLMDDAQKYPLVVEYARSCEAEIARLRTALSDIAYNTSSSVPLGQWPVDHYRDMMHRCIGIAARALEGRE